MTPPTTRSRRRSAVAVLAASATAVGGVALLGPSTSNASSHREAPYIQSDPSVDNTDTYAFVSPDAPDTVTLVANFSGFQNPTGGPNFYPWDTSAAYDINIDNDGDAVPDLTFRYEFKDVDNRGLVDYGDAPDGSFLYNNGPVDAITDENLLFRQVYDLTLITEGAEDQVLLTDAPVAPDYVGKGSMPNYAALRDAAITTVPGSTAKSFAGQADDSFFLDLRVFDLLYGGNYSEVGFDTLAGYNVNTIAYQVPKNVLAAAGDAAANPVIGVWSTTSRMKTRVFADTNAAPGTSVSDSSDTTTDSGEYVQVSRLGAPLVNEAVVPANLKDFFNRTTPDNDAGFLPKVQNPELPILLNAVYGLPNPADTESGADRPDLVAAFLTGIDGVNSLNVNEAVTEAAPAEYLRLNMAIAPTAAGDVNRLGVIGGDNAGFPNGRRLVDDVVDIALQVLAGALNEDTPADLKAALPGFGDGVNANDKAFLSTFPYVATANSGSALIKGQDPVIFLQQFLSESPGSLRAALSFVTPPTPGSTATLNVLTQDGSIAQLATQPLDATGQLTSDVSYSGLPSGLVLTLWWTVTTPEGSQGGTQFGIPTSVVIK